MFILSGNVFQHKNQISKLTVCWSKDSLRSRSRFCFLIITFFQTSFLNISLSVVVVDLQRHFNFIWGRTKDFCLADVFKYDELRDFELIITETWLCRCHVWTEDIGTTNIWLKTPSRTNQNAIFHTISIVSCLFRKVCLVYLLLK